MTGDSRYIYNVMKDFYFEMFAVHFNSLFLKGYFLHKNMKQHNYFYLVSLHLHTWVHFLVKHEICTNNYILLQFPKETNTRGSKTLTPFTPFHTNLQSFDQ